jgi:peptide/nickel transport system permease protein
MLHFIPGDPVLAMLGAETTQEEIDFLRHELWLDRSLPVQYGHWLGNVLQGDFGRSILFREEVSALLAKRLPVTMYLSVWAAILGLVTGIPAGIISAIRRGTVLDNVVTIAANIGIATPVFWLGIVGIYLFGLQLGWLPIQGYTAPTEDFVLSTRRAVMPVICLAVPFISLLARQTRSSMLEIILQDYIRTAKAKGLRERVVVLKHGLKNAMIPIVTIAGMHLRQVFGGSVLVETVFNIPGVGRLMVNAAFDKDILMVQGAVMMMATVTLLANLLVDISYGWIDPRVRYG